MPRLDQASFTGGEISPALAARTDLGTYYNSVAHMHNWFIHVHGGASTRAGFEYIGNASDADQLATRLIEFEFSTEQSYILAFGDLQMRVISNGSFILRAAKPITGITQANPCVVTAVAHAMVSGDETYLSDITGMTELNDRMVRIGNVTANTFELIDIDSTGYTAYVSGGDSSALYQISTPYTAAELPLIKFTQSADVMTLTHPDHEAQELTRTLAIDEDRSEWAISVVSFGSTLTPPIGLAAVTAGTTSGAADKDYGYVVTGIDANGSETVASASTEITMAAQATTWAAKLTWTALAGATLYNVYKLNSVATGIYGYIGQSENPEFTDFNLGPDMSVTPPTNNNPFESNEHPKCTIYHQQRLWFGATAGYPQSIFASKAGDFKNFDLSNPVKSEDSIEVTLATRKVNEIRHLVSIGTLIALTSGGVWRIDGDADGVITPKTITTKNQGSRGCSDVPPVIIGDTVLFIQSLNGKIRDLGYDFNSDKYTGSDLTLLAEHLFYGYQIIDWCYAEEPYGLIWAVRSDGVLLSMAYLKEHQVGGWSHHTTDGEYESVASIAEGNEDVVYAVVKRTVNGETRRYIERLHTRQFLDINEAFAVDSGLTYRGDPTTRVIGLSHLEGETVTALVDGNVVNDLVVVNGAVDFELPGSLIHVGLPYTCDIQTLDVSMKGSETLKTRAFSIPRVGLTVRDTRGLEVGAEISNLYPIKERDIEMGYGNIPSYTGEQTMFPDIDWQTAGGRMFLQQKHPLPATILSLVPEVVTS